MSDADVSLANRLRDLRTTLGDERLTTAFRSDALRDLGTHLSELGADLLRHAAELRSAGLATLPDSRWIPESGTRPGAVRHAHYLGIRPIRSGLVYVAACGASCYPFYGKDTAHQIAHHPRCPACARWADSPGERPDA